MKVAVVRRGLSWAVEVDGKAMTSHATEAEAVETAARLENRAVQASRRSGDADPESAA